MNPARLRDGHGAKWTAVEPDVLPAWVADMDLGIPEPVSARLIGMRPEHPILMNRRKRG